MGLIQVVALNSNICIYISRCVVNWFRKSYVQMNTAVGLCYFLWAGYAQLSGVSVLIFSSRSLHFCVLFYQDFQFCHCGIDRFRFHPMSKVPLKRPTKRYNLINWTRLTIRSRMHWNLWWVLGSGHQVFIQLACVSFVWLLHACRGLKGSFLTCRHIEKTLCCKTPYITHWYSNLPRRWAINTSAGMTSLFIVPCLRPVYRRCCSMWCSLCVR